MIQMIHYGPWHLNTVSCIPLSSAKRLKQKCSRNLETRHIHMLVPPAWTWRLDFSETNTLCLKTVCNVCMFSICLASRNAIGVRKGINVTAATSASITPSGEALWGMSCCTTYPDAEHTAYATTDRNSILNCLYLSPREGNRLSYRRWFSNATGVRASRSFAATKREPSQSTGHR